MSCYSDHNEDIRTKGSCDYCGIGDQTDGPRIGVVQSSDLGDDWSAQRHLDRLAASPTACGPHCHWRHCGCVECHNGPA